MINKINPFFKGSRKYGTIIFGVLPTVSLIMLLTGVIMRELFHIDIAYVIWMISCYAALPYYLIGLFAALLLLAKCDLHTVRTTANMIEHDLFFKIVLIVIPIFLYLTLIILFLYYCYYYRNKRIKAYKHLKKALTAIWTVIAVPLIIFLYLIILSGIRG